MFAVKPKMARRWADHTDDFDTLPDKVGGKTKEGTDLMKTISGLAKQAADAQLVEKLAHDTQITPDLVRHLAGRVNMSPAAFVKAAYADPAGYTIFLKLATGVVKPEQLTKGASASGLVTRLLGIMQSGAKGAANFGRGVAGKGGPATTTASIPYRAGQAINTGAGAANRQANKALAGVGITNRAAQNVGKVGAGTAAVGGTAGLANNAMKSPPASAPEQPGQHEAVVNNQIGGAQAAAMNPAAQAGGAPGAAPAETNAPAPNAPKPGGLGTAGKALIAGGGAAIGALGVGAAMRRRKQNKTVTAADLAKDVMRHAIVKKAAELHRKVAADQFLGYMTKVAQLVPVEKRAAVLKLQAAVAEGKPLSHAIKLAYPTLNGEQRGILATKLVKGACHTKQASPGDPLFKGKKTGRVEANVKMKDGATGTLKAMSN